MTGFATRLNPKVSRYLWPAWLLFTVALTVQPFLWHVRYFESPGPRFYKLILVVLPLLVVTVIVYRSLRQKTLWRYEPLLLGGLLLGTGLLYEPLATLVALWTVAVCYASGRFVLDRLGLATDSHAEEIALPSALGLGLLSFALFLLGLIDAYYGWTFCLLLGIPTIAFRRQVLHLPHEFHQDFHFGLHGTDRVGDPPPRCNGFRTSATFDTPFPAAPAVECCPIAPFRRPQRAFWQHPSRADPRQPAYASLSGPSALASRHR